MNRLNRIQAQTLLEQAQASLQAEHPRLALEQAQQSLHHWPDLMPARLVGAQALTQLQRYDESMRMLDSITQSQPDWHQSPAVGHARAINLLNLGQLDTALALAQSLGEAHPQDISLAWLLWDIQRQKQNPAGSKLAIEHILSLSPDDPTANRLYAAMLETSHPARAAGIYLGLLTEGKHRDAVLGLRAAHCLMQSGQLAQACDTFIELLEHHPQDAELLYHAGVLADELGHDAQACHRLRQAIAQRPTGQACMALGKVHLHAGRMAPAAGCFWKARRFAAVADQAWAGLLVAALTGQRASLVQRCHQRLVRLVPNQLQRQHLLHALWPQAIAGQLVGPRPERKTAEKPACQKSLQELLLYAAGVLSDHAQKFPHRADAHYHLAQCQAALGRRSAAHQSLQQAMAINPRYRAARQLRFRLSRQAMSSAA